MKKNKADTTLALFLTLIIAASFFAVFSTANAQIPVVKVNPFIFAEAEPDPVGVGQQVFIVYWTSVLPFATPDDPSRGSPGGRECWTGITLTITDPEGTSNTVNMPPTDPVGSGFYVYVPDKIGMYSVQAHFPEQWRNRTASTTWGASPALGGGYPNLAYFLLEECESPTVTFTVTEEQLQSVPGVPLPTEYWTRPINAYNRRWYTIAGNWITGNRDIQYITAPDSPHVLWTEPYFYGGIAGGAFDTTDYYEGTAYEGKFRGATIMQGVLFYNENLGSTSAIRKVVARDLRTGNLLWELNDTGISRSWIYNYDSRNQHGLHPYLEVSGNRIIDPFSGTELFNYINVPMVSGFSGISASGVGPNGEILIYVFGGEGIVPFGAPVVNRTWLACWNSTAMLTMTGIRPTEIETYRETGNLMGTGYDSWRPVGKTHNGSDPEAYSWNVTLPPGFQTGYNTYALSDRIIGGTGFPVFRFEAQHGNFRAWCISTKEGSEGEVLWDIRPEPPAANVTLMWSGMSVDDGVLVLRAKDTRQYIGYDIDTGEQLWITEPQPQWMMFTNDCKIYNGKVYAGGYGGEVFAYDVKNGTFLWKAEADAEGLESAYGRAPLRIQVVDGKVYAISQEHSMTNPYYRTWKTYCFDAETGDRLWALTGAWSGLAFADGNMVGMNYFDGQIYCVGKGPSATAVSIQNDVITYGNSVMVKGMVTDVSAGTKSDRIAPRFPNGVPAIADENMSAWMEYVYMQMPKPTDVIGVEVVITTLDPNGNTYELGRTTTDIDGTFGCVVDPPVPGKYKIMATFEGSNSYYGSSGTTYLQVSEAPSAAQTIEPEAPAEEPTEPEESAAPEEPMEEPIEPEVPTEPEEPEEPTEPEPTEPTEAPLFSTIDLAIIAAVAVAVIVGVVAFWQLRKRK